MKKIVAALVVAGSLAGLNAFACGGMTQIDPPSLQLQTGPGSATGQSVLGYADHQVVVC
jgi:hypothetical protein